MINHGVFSLSTQFLSYQIKLAELFWSKRIGETAAERVMARTRMLAGFGLLYGFANSVGVTGAPVSSAIREHLIDDLGYVPGEKWSSTMINEGFPSWAYAMATGNIENFGDRYGSQGWSNLTQATRSDIPWYMAIGGAGVSTVGNFITAALDPFYQGALSWARGDTGDQRFTIKSEHLLQPLKQISTVSEGAKWWTAMQTGHWINNNEQWVTDVSPLRAAFLSLTGMNPQKQDDMFEKNSIVRGEEDAQKAAKRHFGVEWRRGMEAFSNNDPEQGNAFVANAMGYMRSTGMPYQQILKTIAQSNTGTYQSLVDSTDFSFWSRGDIRKQQQRLEQFQREKDLENK